MQQVTPPGEADGEGRVGPTVQRCGLVAAVVRYAMFATNWRLGRESDAITGGCACARGMSSVIKGVDCALVQFQQ